MITQIFSTNI